MKNFLLPILLVSSFIYNVNAQQIFNGDIVSQGEFLGKSIPLRDMPTIDEMENFSPEEARVIQHYADNLGEPTKLDALPLNGDDPVRQTVQGTRNQLNVLENFDGATIAEGQAVPPDPAGAVGPNHYFHAVNVVVKIFDKTGGLLVGPTFLGTFLGNGSSNGDPIIMYDQIADRFFVSQFQISNNALIIGVSDTPDPTGAYNIYSFPLDAFPDYPQYSIWPDAYYVTANKFQGNRIYAIDRNTMLAGGPNPTIVGFTLPGVIRNPFAVYSPRFANLIGTDFDPNDPAYVVYLQDDQWPGVTEDHLKIWEVNVNFANPGSSTVSSPLEIPTEPFDSFLRAFGTGDIRQPNTSQRIDAISGIISKAANFRAFPTYNSWVVTFNTDIGGVVPGVRWIELRNDNSNDWSIFQEGTYAPADGEGRFMGSAAMDQDGNIGLAYHVGSANTPAGIRYTGRLDGDDPGIMTYPESTIIDGGGVQTQSNRFGDYTILSMDPDGVTFWFTGEYFTSTNFWRTRIASFRISAFLTDDLGVFNFVSPVDGNLGNAETVECRIYNFGTDAQSNFPVELYLDGNLVATETFSGTLNSQESANYTFNQTLDLSQPGQTYTIEAKTNLSGDLNAPNDGFVIEVENTLLSIEDAQFNNGEFNVIDTGNRNYQILFESTEDLGDLQYSIYNTIGQQVFAGPLNNEGNRYTAQVSLTEVPVGVYFFNITDGSGKASKRVIVR